MAITYGEYGGERDMVLDFVRFSWDNPVRINETMNRRIFFWGYELWLAPGNTIDDRGAVDLIGTDEAGTVWLVEAKLHSNPELSPDVWHRQVLRYRRALADMKPEDVVMQSRRYLQGNSLNAVAPHFLANGCHSLQESFVQWCNYMGMPAYEKAGRRLCAETLNRIASEQVTGSVLADVARKDVWNGRPADGRDYAYITLSGTGNRFGVHVLLENRSTPTMTANGTHSAAEKTWRALSGEKRSLSPTPENVKNALSTQCVEQYEYLLQGLKHMGWSGNYSTQQKSFTIWLPTHYGPEIGIMLGLVDLDGSFGDVRHKIAGAASFKCDINLKPFRKQPGFEAPAMLIAKRLIQEAHYRGRGCGEVVARADSPPPGWSWILHHWLTQSHRDFTGLDCDMDDIRAVMKILRETCSPDAAIAIPNTALKQNLAKTDTSLPMNVASANTQQAPASTTAKKPLQAKAPTNVGVNETMAALIPSANLRRFFLFLQSTMLEAGLSIPPPKAQATLELHHPRSKHAFGSIQICRPQAGYYLELRFKRDHLRNAGLFEKIDEQNNNPYRQDVYSPTAEAVRFQFRNPDASAEEFVIELAQILKAGIRGE